MITDELLDVLLKPAADEGAADVFISFISYSQGPLPELTFPVNSVELVSIPQPSHVI